MQAVFFLALTTSLSLLISLLPSVIFAKSLSREPSVDRGYRPAHTMGTEFGIYVLEQDEQTNTTNPADMRYFAYIADYSYAYLGSSASGSLYATDYNRQFSLDTEQRPNTNELIITASNPITSRRFEIGSITRESPRKSLITLFRKLEVRDFESSGIDLEYEETSVSKRNRRDIWDVTMDDELVGIVRNCSNVRVKRLCITPVHSEVIPHWTWALLWFAV